MDKQFKNYCKNENNSFEPVFVYRKNGIRITLVTSRLLRTEVQRSSVFCDGPTQAVVNRNFACPAYEAEEKEDILRIITSDCTFIYSFAKKKMISVTLADGTTVTDFKKGNLGGTCRTLDNTNGVTALEPGILSRSGVSVLDDSDSLLIKEDGMIRPRTAPEKDIYYFAYGRDYAAALEDYFRLTGFPPLIPRFALGNWWSRYKAYTQEEYLFLMRRFINERIPVTVATVDMDWHWVRVVEKFGKDSQDRLSGKGPFELFYNLTSPGWTGYSWNTDLFPDPQGFLRELKNEGFRVTMNLHPASGCKFYEDAYPEMAEYMGIDPETKKQIGFDITDPKFISAYFRFLHHPHEKDGVDFWWIDWQQGKKTAVPGLDPLWTLNHYHSLDIARDGKRPLILSRFAGAGSHRYPLGFSGDSAQTWKTLEFQPYFTATASNIGYTWWSHDIGGHHFGIRDDELYLRWVQLGVFSPIMRLHSTSNEFMGKEPWKYAADTEEFAVKYLRLRHRLIPYLYSMNYLTASAGLPLIRPMYHVYPDSEEAYKVPNEYFFGTELIACPITEPVSGKTGLAAVKVYLPDGRYTDVLSDRIYQGGKTVTLYRDKGSFPLLAREGAIIPLDRNSTSNTCKNPDKMELFVYRGNSSFSLYEDDGETMEYKRGKYIKTLLTVSENENRLLFTIGKGEGDRSVVPSLRDYRISFRDIVSAGSVSVFVNGSEVTPELCDEKKYLAIDISGITCEDNVEIILKDYTVRHSPSVKETRITLISKLQGNNDIKRRYLRYIENNCLPSTHDRLYGPLKETLYFF